MAVSSSRSRRFPFVPPAELDKGDVSPHPVIVVGAGPVGLACALDLAQQGISAVVLDAGDTVSAGSRAICYAKRTLEVLDRLGCGEAVTRRGVGWQVGKVFHRDSLAFSFDLLPEEGHRRPAFVNLQQYLLEEILLDRLQSAGGATVRWCNRVTGVVPDDNGVLLTVDTPAGAYTTRAAYVIACDGARSTVRDCLGLEWRGQVFRDRFLIADVRMRGDFPTERWFWFDPPFHPGQSVLLHRQADDVWRIDFQLGWDADPELEREPARVSARIRAMLGNDQPFDIEWVSVYTFQCRRLDHFVHGRVIFAGDSAHQVSPFGARGANSGIQDADNLCWKLGRVLKGVSPPRLLDSYDRERVEAADENIRNSTRSTDFITPKSAVSRIFRDAVLDLSMRHPFARRLVNSGRLSLPTAHRDSVLSTPDRDAFAGAMTPGAPSSDAPVRVAGKDAWWLDLVGGRFEVVLFAADDPPDGRDQVDLLARTVAGKGRLWVVVPPGTAAPATGSGSPREVEVEDALGLLAARYDAVPGTLYLLRPDQHVVARWRHCNVAEVEVALRRAQGYFDDAQDSTEYRAA